MTVEPEQDGETGEKRLRVFFFLNESTNSWLSDFDRQLSKEETNTPPGCLSYAERERSRHQARRQSANTDLTLTHSSLCSGGGRRARGTGL